MIRHILWAASLAMALSTALPAFAVDNMDASTPVDLTSVRAKIAAKDYKGALAELRDLAEDNQQADVYNLLGFTLRKPGDYETSLSYYVKALDLQGPVADMILPSGSRALVTAQLYGLIARVYLGDLVRPYGVALREDLLERGVGHTYAEMAEPLQDLLDRGHALDHRAAAARTPSRR